MWANAPHDGRPAEYRWHLLFNAAKFGWCPLLECRAVTLPRRGTAWNLLGCSKLAKGSQPSVGQSSPYYQDMYSRYCYLTSFYSNCQYMSSLGTCESFFCVRIESRIESAVRFDFESNFRTESAVYTTQAVTPSNELHRYLFCICHEREWCTQLSTCYSFQFSPKLCRCTII